MSELAGDGAEGRGEDPEEEKRRSSHGLKKSQGKKEGIERRKDGGKGVGKKEKAGGVDEAKVDRARRGQSDVSEPGVRQGRGVKHAKLRREGKGGGGTSEGIKKHPVAKGASAITKSKQKMKNGDSFSVIGPLSGEASAVSNGSKVAPASTSPTTVSVEKKKLGKQKKGNNKKGSRSNDEVDGSRNATGESGAQQKREESMADGVAVSATKKWPSVKRKNKVGHCLFSEGIFFLLDVKMQCLETMLSWANLHAHTLVDPQNLSPQRGGRMLSKVTAWGRYWFERFVGFNFF